MATTPSSLLNIPGTPIGNPQTPGAPIAMFGPATAGGINLQGSPAAPLGQGSMGNILQPAGPPAPAPAPRTSAIPAPTTYGFQNGSSYNQGGQPVQPQQPQQPQQTYSFGDGSTYDQNGKLIDPNQQIAQNAGLANLSTTDYLSLLGSQTATNKDQLAAIRAALGLPAAETSAFALPTQSTVDVYNQGYSAAGLADLKQRISDFNNQIAETNQQYIDAVGKENENPFLSEASRVGRTANLYNTAQQTIGNLINEQSNAKDLYAQGVNEVNNLVTRHTNDFTLNQSTNQQKLNYLLGQVEKQSTAQQNTNLQGMIARYTPQYLQSKASATQTTPITAGNGATFQWNKQTGTFDMLTPPVSTNSPFTNPDGTVSSFNTQTGQFNSGQPAAGATGAFTSSPGTTTGTYGNFGYNINPQTNQPFRTDSNSNPIAAAVTQGGSNQFTKALDQAGIKWTYGTPFGSNSTMSTIKVLGDPMEASRAILANSNAIQGWYANSTGRAVLAQYGIHNNTEFAQAPKQTQDAVINGIYQAENGNQTSTLLGGGSQGNPQSNPQTQAQTLPPIVQKYVESLPNIPGSQYINSDRVPSTQISAVQSQSAGKVPVLTANEVSGLKSIDVIFKNLNSLNTLSQQLLSSGLAGRIKGLTTNQAQAVLQSDPRFAQFQLARDTAIKTVQALAGGAGSGLKLNQGEIETSANNLPTITDNLGYAQQKIDGLKALLTNQLSETLPGIAQQTPNGSGTGSSVDLSDLNFLFQ